MKKQLYVIESRKNIKPKVLPIDPAKSDDPFYRYKMRQLIVQVVGKGKMIRTAMVNLDDVAHDLQVPADYIPNYFGKTIGATAKYDPKKPERERGSISGEYDIKELSETLLKFIHIFVLCKKCRYPEFAYYPVKKNIRVKCKSCGLKTDVHKMGLSEKFKRYILNHPPPKPQKVVKKKVGKAKAKSNMKKDDWSQNLSEEAVKERMKDMVPDNLQGLVASDGADDQVKLGSVLATYAENHPDPEDVVAELTRMKELYSMNADMTAGVIFNGLFATDINKLYDHAKKYENVIRTHIVEDPSQVRFLRCLESKIQNTTPTPKNVIKSIPGVFQAALYDPELFTEDAFAQWEEMEVINKPMRKAARPFLEWLKEAEDSSEEESDEEEDATNADAGPATIDDEIDAL